jgi:diguanylate cyclase (GGDEF)-like protein
MALGANGFFRNGRWLARAMSRIIFVLPLLTLLSLLAALLVFYRDPTLPILVALATVLLSTGLGIFLERMSTDELGEKMEMAEKSRRAHQQVEELFAMTDMLQAAEDHEDAGAVLEATAQRLLPEYGGALYVFNNSRDRLDLAKSWNTSEGFAPTDSLLPGNCWALKRGKPHINSRQSQTLCCTHHEGSASILEVPMMARGQVHGLLVLGTEDDHAFERLMAVRRLGRAVADSMSLALSNIALREKLRTQSLRDPLTGLYNRRYMEDALDRYISLAERTGGSTAVLMIDLDNFKRLNDQHGHAKGDAVLRDVAGQLVAALRPSDVVSRFGGEELVVIMPNCSLEDAAIKAEMLRARVEGLSEAHGFPICASFGVAAVPETATSPVDVIPRADAALYAAKMAGKNCVIRADRRAAKDEDQLRLAVG